MACKTANIFSLILLTEFLYIAQVASSYARQPLVQRSKPLPGSPVKLQVINLEKSSSSRSKDDIVVDGIADNILHRSRRAVNPDFTPKIVRMHLNDSHNMAYVHWSGDNRETVVILTRDRTMYTRSTSAVWISRDYAQTFQNYTTSFKLYNGTVAQISLFYASPIDKMKYIFVSRLYKYMFTSTDDCRTIRAVRLSFTPDDITFHVSDSNVILAYDRTSYIKRLYVSQDFGSTWTLKDERVKSYYWGIPPYESYNTLFIEREELTGGQSLVVKTNFFTNRAVSIASGVKDFEVMGNFMFATKPATGGRRGLRLMVSYNRGPFQDAQIPTSSPTLDFLVSDVSENQVFLSVSHSVRTTHLYISDATGVKYSLSLPRVLYFSIRTGSSWLRRYIHHSFVDLHKVDSLRGVYIASQLSQGAVGRRHLSSYITFDKGGEWKLIQSPRVDADNKRINCSLPTCSLHVSQDFGHYYPFARYSPMLSSPSAPGLILAMGTIGKSLKLNADLFLSSNGGLTWNEVLKGSYFYSMGDHGGILIAVQRGSPTNLFYYSWNEGEHWLSQNFIANDRIYVYGILTEPGERNTKFTIFGSHTQKHEWIVVHVDLQKTLGNPCRLSQDYKEWIPSDEYNTTCLLGRKSVYKRRIAHAHCYNGYDFDRPITVQNCECSRDDFECDVGYKLISGISCIWDTASGLTPTPIPPNCPAGSTYLKSKGFRKVVGDTCIGGRESDYAPTNVACPVSSLPEFLLFAQRRYIKRITIGSNVETTLPLSGLQQTIAIDFDYKENAVYWADIQQDVIKRAFLNGSGVIETLHSSMQQVEGLALDWMGNNIYWIDAGAKKIEVSRNDGKYRKILYTDPLDRPRALALDPMRGVMFWTDWGTTAMIVKADMSGNNSHPIIRTSLRWPNGICIDFTDNKIYWTDAWYDKIERSDFDGSNRQVVTSTGLQHPYSISIYKQYMYWDDWSSQSIMRAYKIGASNRRVIKSSVVGLMDLKVFHHDIQQGSNACSNSSCKFLCLASSVYPYFQCSCPDNMLSIPTPSGGVSCSCQNHTTLDSKGDCTTQTGTCPSHEFTCSNGNCIPMSWKCDHENDCGDNSDETGCPHPSCSPGQFGCANGQCIRQSWVCDHDNDCGDMSDERNCSFPTCRSDQFTCRNHRCISSRWVCDHDNDCRDGSDEDHCTPAPPTTSHNITCSSGYFTCSNGRCIPQRWYCDNDNDCGDNSDEPINCHRRVTCSSSQFTCRNHRCISLRWHCDGDNDCGDYSDEIGCVTRTTVAPQTYTPPPCSGSSEFKCRNGHCVGRDVCHDGVNDCGDNSDETICVPYSTRAPIYTTGRPCRYYEFRCRNGWCVNSTKRCNSGNDCGDWSDEIGCTVKPPTTHPVPTTHTVKPICYPPFVLCEHTPTICIDPSWVCDGKADCPDATDERNCPTNSTVHPTNYPTCKPNTLNCDVNKCIPKDKVCDGTKDCKDGSDEEGCQVTPKSIWDCNALNGHLGAYVCDQSKYCFAIDKKQCLSGNAGNCRDNTDVKICGIPYKKLVPLQLKSYNKNESLILSWTKPLNKPLPDSQLIGYVVQYRVVKEHDGSEVFTAGHTWKTIEVKDSTKTSLSLPQLVICSEYEFTVQIAWSTLIGPIAEPIKGKTPRLLTEAPYNLSYQKIDKWTVKLMWHAPKRYCQTISDYRVNIDCEGKKRRIQYTGNVNFTVIQQLNGTETYVISVQAYYSEDVLGRESLPLYIVPPPTADRRTSHSKKPPSKLIWAIPVGIISVLFVLGLVILLAYYIRKSHRLQGSMYALLRRNDQDSGGEVTFHSDDDDPLIRGFADDVPLVTA